MSPHVQIEKRLEPVDEGEDKDSDDHRSKSGCTIFLGYTSNLISSGVRESIRYLVEHKMVHVDNVFVNVVTSQVKSQTITRDTRVSEPVASRCLRWTLS